MQEESAQKTVTKVLAPREEPGPGRSGKLPAKSGASNLASADRQEGFWLPPRDSNPDMLIQSQLSYH